MTIRLALMADLTQIQTMFTGIIERMERDGIRIWDEVYPNQFFAEDIGKRRLYLLEHDGAAAGAFALCDGDPGEGQVEWADCRARALYLNRLGVCTGCLRQGYGRLLLGEAERLTRVSGAAYLRLFVVDSNGPAIRLYEESGFRRMPGGYDKCLDCGTALHEFAYEKQVDGGQAAHAPGGTRAYYR